MSKWLIKELKQIPETFSLSLHPLVAKILFARNISSEEEMGKFIAPNYDADCHDPFLFVEMEKVVQRIKLAQDKKEKVVIFGDYDADGITASAILKETFGELGIESFVYIPDKQVEGYGMNMEAVESFAKKDVKLIITVDCGITGIAEVEKAKELGIDVIITDHHHVPDAVPPAFAIINPHQAGCGYPFADLAGVGVAFKVAQAIYQKLLDGKKDQLKWMLDLVAIGTVADCVPLVGENRLFVKYGMIVLSKTRRVGLKELFTVGRILIDETTATDTKKISFYIAPRINAAGRIKHANLAYDLLMENDAVRARGFALELEGNNTQRQKITEKIVEEVRILAKNMYKDKKFIFAVGEHFPVGVVGLVAGKIAQEFNKPTVVIQKSEEVSKGSFRSIPQLNIIETIGQCSELLEKFGGHAQAAGVSVRNDQLENFYQKINSLIEQKLDGLDLALEITADGELSSNDVDFNLVEDLEKLKPFGEGNAEPVFLMKALVVREKRTVGSTNKHVKMMMTPSDGAPKMFETISFNGAEKFESIKEGDCIDIICTVQKDEWNGNKKIQMTLIDARISDK